MTWSPQHRGDFLNLPFRGTLSGYWSGKKYYKASPAVRAAYRAALKAHGYTRIYFDIFQDLTGHDYFGDPEALAVFLQEAVADELGCVLFVLPEGDPAAMKQYGVGKGKLSTKYLTALTRLVRICGRYTSDWIIGVEADEVMNPPGHPEDEGVWSVGEELISTIGQKLGAALKSLPPKRKPLGPASIWVHFTTGWHGRWAWWKQQPWATGLSYQFHKSDMGHGFNADLETIREETSVYSARLKTSGGSKKMLAGEHTWMRPEAKGVACGDVALERGAIGAMNGCSERTS